MFSRRESFKQYIKLYPIVSTLIAINIFIFLLTIIPVYGIYLRYMGMGINLLIAEGEYWRLITSMFLHSGFAHLLFNMFSLYIFGPELEQLTGKARFLTIYFLSGFMGNVATYLIHDWNYAGLGASGAIYGILGAFAALVYYAKHLLPQLRQIIIPIIVIGVILSFLQPNVGVTAHLGGLVTGFILGMVYFYPKRIASWKKKKNPYKVVK